MRLKMPDHPVMQILHIGNRIHNRPLLHHKRILTVQRRAHDPRLVLPGLEMRIRETEEDLRQLGLAEEVGQELHRVGPHAGDVLVETRGRVLGPEGADAVLDEFGDLGADFEAWSCG